MRVPARFPQPFQVIAPNARETDSVHYVSSSLFPLSPPQIPLLPADAFAAGLVCQGPRISVSTISLRLPGEYVPEKCQIDFAWVVPVPAFAGALPLPLAAAQPVRRRWLSTRRWQVAHFARAALRSKRLHPAVVPNIQDTFPIPRNYPAHPASRPASSPADQSPWVGSPQCAPSSSVLLCFETAPEHRVPVSWRSGWRSRVR